MTRAFVILALAVAAHCMEVRETEQRMVMVTHTGSNSAPQAKGFIYKRESDKPAKVVKIAEDKVMEQLTKIYLQPQAFKAPIPVAAGPFYNKEQDSSKAGSEVSEDLVIPVKEHTEEAQDERIPGVSDDYAEFMKDYAANYADYKSDFDEYLRSLGYKDGEFHYDSKKINDGKSDGDESKSKGSNDAEKNDDDYSTKKYQSYAIETGKSQKNEYGDSDSFGEDKGSHDGEDFKEGESKGKAINGYFIFDKDFKDDKLYDGDAVGDFGKYRDGHDYDFGKGSSYESDHEWLHHDGSDDDHDHDHFRDAHHRGSFDDSAAHSDISYKTEHR